MSLRRLWILACALARGARRRRLRLLGVSQPTTQPAPLSGHEVGNEINDGSYVQAGPITYQLQISRELNPYSVRGQASTSRGCRPGSAPPNANQLWYGVFLWAKNQHHQAYRTSDNFKIVDTQGITYYPISSTRR